MINYISSPFKWFFKLEAASGILLLISAIAALIVSNSEFSIYYFETLNKYLFIGINNFGLKLSVLHWINDALMAIFFFFVTLEIKREFLQGELSSLKQAMLPIIGAVGGVGLGWQLQESLSSFDWAQVIIITTTFSLLTMSGEFLFNISQNYWLKNTTNNFIS